MVKTRIYSDDENVKVPVSDVLSHILASSLKLLHPFMPFITTEIYPHLVVFGEEELMISNWPKIREEFVFDKEEALVETLKQIIVEIRNVRSNMNIHPSKKSELIFVTDKYEKEILESQEFLLKLGFGDSIKVQKDKTGIPENAISIIKDGIELYIPLNNLVDMEEERNRLTGEIEKLEKEVERASKMLSNPGFTSKAPKEKVEEEKEKLAKYEEMLKITKEKLDSMK